MMNARKMPRLHLQLMQKGVETTGQDKRKSLLSQRSQNPILSAEIAKDRDIPVMTVGQKGEARKGKVQDKGSLIKPRQ